MDLLAGHRAQIEEAERNIFDSFKKPYPLKFIKIAQEEILILDPEYNSDLEEFNYENTNLVEQSREFYCRVIFPRWESTSWTSIPNIPSPVKASQQFAEVLIQFEEEAYEYIGATIRFTLLGENYQKSSDIRRIGMSEKYKLFELYLKKLN